MTHIGKAIRQLIKVQSSTRNGKELIVEETSSPYKSALSLKAI